MRTVRSECLDWLLILGPRHLERVLCSFVEHYNHQRPHRALGLGPPVPLEPQPPPASGTVKRRDRLGGLIPRVLLGRRMSRTEFWHPSGVPDAASETLELDEREKPTSLITCARLRMVVRESRSTATRRMSTLAATPAANPGPRHRRLRRDAECAERDNEMDRLSRCRVLPERDRSYVPRGKERGRIRVVERGGHLAEQGHVCVVRAGPARL